jgi:hypothetical protein
MKILFFVLDGKNKIKLNRIRCLSQAKLTGCGGEEAAAERYRKLEGDRQTVIPIIQCKFQFTSTLFLAKLLCNRSSNCTVAVTP